MSGTFDKDSLGWQIQLLQMRFAEWIDRIFQPKADRPNVNPPQWLIPEWFSKLLLQGLFWLIVIAALAWVGWMIIRLVSPYLGMDWFTRKPRHPNAEPEVEALSISEWLQRSRALAQRGNYREACRALYQAALQKLDERELILNRASRTDGEYVSLLQTLPNPRPYEVLITTHERLCFSKVTITRENFVICEQAYREIETP